LSATSSSPGAGRPAIGQRLRQGLHALRPVIPPDREAILAEALTPGQAAAFRGLSPHDQAHLCRVYRWLRERGGVNRDLLVAALLHDIGKEHPAGQVRLLDRVARVVLVRLAPGLLRRLAAWPAPRWRRGLALAVHHPRLGAERAAALGCSARTCWLIAHHEDRPLPDDRELRLLVEADRACP
jgi:hypothetical protein